MFFNEVFCVNEMESHLMYEMTHLWEGYEFSKTEWLGAQDNNHKEFKKSPVQAPLTHNHMF